MTDDVDQRLAALGRDGEEPPDPSFVDSLEYRLRAAHVEGARLRDGSGVSILRRPILVLGAFLVLTLLGLGFAVLRDGGAPAVALELAEAVDTLVELPDGRVLVDPVGVDLPVGSVIQVGPEGRAVTADGVVLDVDRAVEVADDGSLRRVDRVVEPPTTRAPSTRPPATTVAVDRPVDGDRPAPTTTVETRRPASDAPTEPTPGSDEQPPIPTADRADERTDRPPTEPEPAPADRGRD